MDSLMMAYADLKEQSKGSSFKGPALKDVKVAKTQAPTFKVSTKSRDWSSLSQNLEDAFVTNDQRTTKVPQVQVGVFFSVKNYQSWE